MRYIRTAILVALAIILVTIALANRGPMTLRVLPEPLQDLLGVTWELTLPIFVVLVLAIGAGLLLGFVWEWVREHKHRSAAVTERRKREDLEKQMTQHVPKEGKGDDTLALVEKS